MFIEHVNRNILFHDNNDVYTYDDLIYHVKCAQHKIQTLLKTPSVIGFCSHSSFFELTAIIAFLELGHKILFVPKKHIFYYDIYNNFFNELDLIVDLIGDEINDRNINVVGKDFLFSHVEQLNDLVIETDDLKSGFVFLSSGTTGKPKVIEQTHRRLIHAAHQTMNRIWCNNKNFLLHRGNTINHLGIFTTTYLPAIFIGENVSWYSHIKTDTDITILHSDTNPIYNSTLLFPYQPLDIVKQLPLSNGAKIITGGTSIKDEFLNQLFENEKIELIYNVYGATEIITPIMWYQIDRESTNRNFNQISEGLTINVNQYNQIETISGLIDSDKPVEIPDSLKLVEENEYRFIVRKQQFLYRPLIKKEGNPLKNNIHNITLTEDECIKLLSDELGEFNIPEPIIIKNNTDKDYYSEYYLIYDPKKHSKIEELSVEKLNEIVYMYYGVNTNHLDDPLITDKIPIEDLSNFNNGLKIDRGVIKKIISNKINKSNKNII